MGDFNAVFGSYSAFCCCLRFSLLISPVCFELILALHCPAYYPVALPQWHNPTPQWHNPTQKRQTGVVIPSATSHPCPRKESSRWCAFFFHWEILSNQIPKALAAGDSVIRSKTNRFQTLFANAISAAVCVPIPSPEFTLRLEKSTSTCTLY